MSDMQVERRTALTEILRELEEAAIASGEREYRRLKHGLVLRIESNEMGFQLAIARQAPGVPSEIEERTILRDLEPVFAGAWHRTNNRSANDGRYYNVSTIDYHR